MAMIDPVALEQGIRNGDRRAIARAITLVESSRPDHQPAAAELLERLAQASGQALRTSQALRVGLSGAPGVGKSTFIESIGTFLVERGHKIAVLAVDPSSAVSGGSILGDKTRMERLAADPHAYIRPTPSGTSLGGVGRRTPEAIRIVEAAGFDVVIVETVGVGQSEAAVAAMTDIFVLLLAPGAGDELQGIKRGIVELAHLVLVNKADGDLADEARRTAAEYRNAFRMLAGGSGRSAEAHSPAVGRASRPESGGSGGKVEPRTSAAGQLSRPGTGRSGGNVEAHTSVVGHASRPGARDSGWKVEVHTCSALTGSGIAEAWERIERYRAWYEATGARSRRRSEQARGWLWREIADGFRATIESREDLKRLVEGLEEDVAAGRTPATAAARRIVAAAFETVA